MLIDLVYCHTKDEDVLISHLFLHLNVGAIQRADGEGAIQLEKDIRKEFIMFTLYNLNWNDSMPMVRTPFNWEKTQIRKKFSVSTLYTYTLK